MIYLQHMKKIVFFALLFCASFLSYGQVGEDNVFRQSENGSNNVNTSQENQQGDVTEEPNGPGGPGEPAPVDQYIPFLLLAAAGLAVYTQRRKIQKN